MAGAISMSSLSGPLPMGKGRGSQLLLLFILLFPSVCICNLHTHTQTECPCAPESPLNALEICAFYFSTPRTLSPQMASLPLPATQVFLCHLPPLTLPLHQAQEAAIRVFMPAPQARVAMGTIL